MNGADAPPPAVLPCPTPAEAQRISALEDPILRNLQITQCYYELSSALASQLPGGANWCTVATWASRQAGQSIRRQDLQRALQRLLQHSAEIDRAAENLEAQGAAVRGEPEDASESLGGAVAALKEALSPAAAFERVSQAVARGNQKVFAEIGAAFARFMALFDVGRPSDEAVAAFCQTLRPGDPPEGQRYLQQAFSHYHQAMGVTAEKERAELMLLANLEIGFHEQTRLQPEIRAAMDAPVYDPAALRRRLLLELFPDPGSWARLAVMRVMGRAKTVVAARDRLAAEAQQLGRRVVTEQMMTLELSRGQVLRLGQDLPVGFPPSLRALADPDLRSLLARVDPTPDRQTGTGSADWSDLPQRMHFIADLFRAYHLDATLFDPPFATAQVSLLKTGQVPADL